MPPFLYVTVLAFHYSDGRMIRRRCGISDYPVIRSLVISSATVSNRKLDKLSVSAGIVFSSRARFKTARLARSVTQTQKFA